MISQIYLIHLDVNFENGLILILMVKREYNIYLYTYIYINSRDMWLCCVASLKINEFITSKTRNIRRAVWGCVGRCDVSYGEFPGKWHFTRSLSHIARGKYSILLDISIFIHIEYQNTFMSPYMYKCVSSYIYKNI